MPTYDDNLDATHNPATSTSPPASYGDKLNANFQCLERVISHTVLGSAAASISSGTLATVTNGWLLKILCRVQNSAGTAATVSLRFNSDSGSNYSRQSLTAANTTVAAGADGAATTSIRIATCGNESANRWATGEALVFDYLGSGHKTVQSRGYDPKNLTAPLLDIVGAVWTSTSAITSVQLICGTANFVTGSSLTVLATPSI